MAVLWSVLSLFAVSVRADLTNVIFADDFESGTLANWTTTGASPFDIAGFTNAVPPSPTGLFSAGMNISTDRMHHNLIGDNGGVEVTGRAVFTSWIYDPGAGSTATRIFNEVRGYSGGTGFPNGGTTASGSLAQLLAAGKYNTVTRPGETHQLTKYQARAAFTTNVNIYWFNLNGPGSPDRSPGWHRFDIERLADGTTVNFYVDGILSRTVTGTVNQSWDTIIMGPGLGSTVGETFIDGISVSVMTPQPRLTIASVPEGYQICWMSESSAFTLQSATRLATPNVWETVTNAVQVQDGTNYCVTVAGEQVRRFYRLFAPASE